MTSGGSTPSGAESQLRSVLDAAGLGTFDLDVSTGRIVVDRRARDAFGLPDDRVYFPVDDLLGVIHPDDLPAVEEALSVATTSLGSYSVEHRVRLPSRERWYEVHGQAVAGPDGRVRLIGTIRDSTDLRLARDEAARVLEHVREALLFLDEQGRVSYVNNHGERMLRRSRDELLGRMLWDDFPTLLGPQFAELGHTASSTEPLVLEDFSEALGLWVELRAHRHPGGTTVYLLDVSVRRATQDRTRRLQQIAAALARALTSSDVMHATLEHVVRGVGADSAGILVVDDERRELRLAAGLEELAPAVRDRWTRLPLSASTPLNQAVEAGTPQLLTRLDVLDRYPNMARDVEDIGAAFYVLLPLVTAGRPLGVVALGWVDRTTIDDDEFAFLLAVVAQCAQALERAQLYEQQRRIAESLQRSLLPQELPAVPHVDLGARYLAGAAGLQVGGDWYDVLPLPDGRVAFALGDVMGKGLPAAAAMGEVRYALRAYAILDPAPATVLRCLDDFFATRNDEEIVTLVYGVLDPRDGVLVWSNAGHPPPLLVGVDTRTLSARSDGTPLGVRSSRQESTLQLTAGEALLLYSDGVVESRSRPVGDGVQALLAVAAEEATAGSSADDLAGRALLAMLGTSASEDDATLLSVRWTGGGEGARVGLDESATDTPPQVASTKLRPEALASSSARRFIRSLLEQWDLLELSDIAELCVSELVTNAVLHARTPIQLEVRSGSGLLHVDVCDSGGSRIDLPPREQPGDSLESGRGLYIVQALTKATGVKASRGGTCVWFELDLPADEETDERSGRADVG